MKLKAYSDRCSGCRACLLACALTNFSLNNPKYGTIGIIPHFPSPGTYEVRVCTRCGECEAACPTGAIKRQPDGSYRVDAGLCVACGNCVSACPQGVVRMVAEKNVAFVCVNCGECVKYCPREALVDEDGEVSRV